MIKIGAAQKVLTVYMTMVHKVVIRYMHSKNSFLLNSRNKHKLHNIL